MAQGVLDVYVSKDRNDNSLALITNCEGGLPNDLYEIPNGAELTLRRGDITGKVEVFHDVSTECAFNYMEIDEKTAKTFGIRDGNRIVLTYDPDSKELKMQRLTKSKATAFLSAEFRNKRDNAIVIGYALLSALGIPDKPGMSLTFRKGADGKKLRVFIPDNALSAELRLSPANLRKFDLLSGRQYLLEYDQTSQTLKVASSAAVTGEAGQGGNVPSSRKSAARPRAATVYTPEDKSTGSGGRGAGKSAVANGNGTPHAAGRNRAAGTRSTGSSGKNSRRRPGKTRSSRALNRMIRVKVTPGAGTLTVLAKVRV